MNNASGFTHWRLAAAIALVGALVTPFASARESTKAPPESSSAVSAEERDVIGIRAANEAIEGSLLRESAVLELPRGINLAVYAKKYGVAWTVSIGSNAQGPARLIDLARAVGMDDHERTPVLVAWSDRVAIQLRDLTTRVMRDVRPDIRFYPETELEVCVQGHPFRSELAKDDPKRKEATRFEREYRGSDCVRYVNGERKITAQYPRSASLGTVSARVAFDPPVWDLGESKQGVLTLTNATPNRVCLDPVPIADVSRDGVDVPFHRNSTMCIYYSQRPGPLVLEPGQSGSQVVELTTSTGYGTFELSAGEYKVTVKSNAEASVPVQVAIATIMAIGSAPQPAESDR